MLPGEHSLGDICKAFAGLIGGVFRVYSDRASQEWALQGVSFWNWLTSGSAVTARFIPVGASVREGSSEPPGSVW